MGPVVRVVGTATLTRSRVDSVWGQDRHLDDIGRVYSGRLPPKIWVAALAGGGVKAPTPPPSPAKIAEGTEPVTFSLRRRGNGWRTRVQRLQTVLLVTGSVTALAPRVCTWGARLHAGQPLTRGKTGRGRLPGSRCWRSVIDLESCGGVHIAQFWSRRR